MIEEVSELSGDASPLTPAPTEATDNSAEAAPEEKPRRRRVTRKSADAELPLEGVEASTNEAPAKPKRVTRKKKTDDATDEAATASDGEAAPAKPKRITRTTRAKKAETSTDQTETSTDARAESNTKTAPEIKSQSDATASETQTGKESKDDAPARTEVKPSDLPQQDIVSGPAPFQVAPAAAMGSFTSAPTEGRNKASADQPSGESTARGNEGVEHAASSDAKSGDESNENSARNGSDETGDDDDFRGRLSYRDRRAMRREQRIVARGGRDEETETSDDTRGARNRDRDDRPARDNTRDGDNRGGRDNRDGDTRNDNRGDRNNRDNDNRGDRNNRNNRGDRNDRNNRNNRGDRNERNNRNDREPRENRRERNGNRGREYDLTQLEAMDGEAFAGRCRRVKHGRSTGRQKRACNGDTGSAGGRAKRDSQAWHPRNPERRQRFSTHRKLLSQRRRRLRFANPDQTVRFKNRRRSVGDGPRAQRERALSRFIARRKHQRFEHRRIAKAAQLRQADTDLPDTAFPRSKPMPTNITARIIDLISPIGKGQRGLIVAPPKAGKTTLIKNIANSITENNPEVMLFVLLIDERPEEVTDISRSVRGEVVASTFDEVPENHIRVSDIVMERAKRLVEQGNDVVVLMDSITRLSRASNLVVAPSGRTMSGGLDPAAMYKPKRHFGAARNIEGGGSLTVLATVLVDTGSRMDEYIFEELKGTGNLDLVLDRDLFNQRIFPAIDINRSGTRRDDLLLSKEELAATFHLRRTLAALDNDKAVSLLIDRLKNTKSNADFMEVVAKSQRNAPA